MVVRIGQGRTLRPIWFREWREDRGLTLEGLAALLGTGKSAVLKIETGESRYNQASLEALAEALQCYPEDLTAGPPPPRGPILGTKPLPVLHKPIKLRPNMRDRRKAIRGE